jgi:hypothetical protein
MLPAMAAVLKKQGIDCERSYRPTGVHSHPLRTAVAIIREEAKAALRTNKDQQ